MAVVYLVFSFLMWITTCYGLNNGLALTPPMGWMHWQRYRCLTDCEAYPDECISEKLFLTMADLMVSEGYKDVGYEYIMIDDCWMEKTRDEDGKLQADKKRFPNGIKPVIDYVHSKGLKFGIYADYGTKTCAGYPGSLGYLKVDAETFAEWGADYLKFDGCHSELLINILDQGYAEMGRFLNETGRPIVYSCSWPAYQEPKNITADYVRLAEVCNLWRNWDDIDDSWQSVTGILKWFGDNQDRFADYAGPGHWNDPDMLLIGNFGLSYEQSKAQMAIWAIMAAPLIMSVDLKAMQPQFKDILQNKDVISINQDSLGIQGRRVVTSIHKTKIDIWTRPINPVIDGSRSYAIGILSNRVDGYPYRLNFTLSEINLTHHVGYALKDIYEPSVGTREVGLNDTIYVRVKPSGVVLLVAVPLENPEFVLVWNTPRN